MEFIALLFFVTSGCAILAGALKMLESRKARTAVESYDAEAKAWVLLLGGALGIIASAAIS